MKLRERISYLAKQRFLGLDVATIRLLRECVCPIGMLIRAKSAISRLHHRNPIFHQ
jgi:hypothetical protein